MDDTLKLIKPMTEAVAHKSYRLFEKEIEHYVKIGKYTREQARKLLADARKNYSGASYNRQLELIKKGYRG